MADAELTKKCEEFGQGSKAKGVTSKVLTKIFKDCKLYGKTLTSTDTDIAHSKICNKVCGKGVKELPYSEVSQVLKELAPKYKTQIKCDSDDTAMQKMIEKIKAGAPSTAGTTGTSKTGGVGKMTDTSKYTGAHKERFDESGKGKGASGRKDEASNTGYVGAYKGDGSFDKKK